MYPRAERFEVAIFHHPTTQVGLSRNSDHSPSWVLSIDERALQFVSLFMQRILVGYFRCARHGGSGRTCTSTCGRRRGVGILGCGLLFAPVTLTNRLIVIPVVQIPA